MADSYFTVDHISTKDLKRLFSKIQISDVSCYEGTHCWEWTAATTADYGVIKWRGKLQRVHRIMYAWLIAPLPPWKTGVEIDHLCRNPRCSNPLHLELVAQRINTARGQGPTALNARKTHCQRGHVLEGENLYLNSKGYRHCRACMQRKNKEWMLTHRGKRREYSRQRAKPYRDAHLEERRTYAREYHRKNRDRLNALRNARRAAQRQGDNGQRLD